MQQAISLDAEQVTFPVVDEVARKRESSRQIIAFVIVGTLAFAVLASFISLWVHPKGSPADDVVKVVQAVLSPVIGIVGAVTGFYFGEHRAEITSKPS